MRLDLIRKGVTQMSDDEKIREAQEILNWAIINLEGKIKCKVMKYKSQNYQVQFFTKEDKLIMPVQIPEEWIKQSDPQGNVIEDKLKTLLKNLGSYS
jgi:hypothetical protein